MSESAIEIQSLTKVYSKYGHAPIHALDGISFNVEKGQIFGLLGPNGAGKSTTIKILTTLLTPTSGTARVLGYDAVHQAIEVRKNICVVVQENAIELYLSVRNNFNAFCRFHGLSKREIEHRIGRVCELFDLRESLNERGMDLSGGVKRRVQVAKMFLVDKPIVFLDEATTGMDAFNKRTTVKAIREESHKGRTILLTTHMLDEAEELCDSLVIIHHGKIIASGNIDEVKSMSLNLYSLSISFEPVSLIDKKWIEQWKPVSIEFQSNTCSMTVQSEIQALSILNEIQKHTKINDFEVTHASLEDAFIELVDKKGVTLK
jgi:ABC-type multidrug transport system ATPase subunit